MISCAAGVHGHVSCCIECVRAAGGGAGHQPVALEHVLDQSGDDARPQAHWMKGKVDGEGCLQIFNLRLSMFW
eukprot:scaffold36699_cov18-Tisochrysis_lutea.AAC.6